MKGFIGAFLVLIAALIALITPSNALVLAAALGDADPAPNGAPDTALTVQDKVRLSPSASDHQTDFQILSFVVRKRNPETEVAAAVEVALERGGSVSVGDSAGGCHSAS